MRIGSNPRKEDPKLQGYGIHRLIMPVYIPNQEGYFAQSLDILRICLESLRLTRKPETAVTIVANGCCAAVKEFLVAEQDRGWLDQVLINSENRGKVDAIIGVARGCFEEAITFSDSDVLFRPAWDTAVESVFRAFPECGFVCPFPSPGGELLYTSAVFMGAIWKMSFRTTTDRADLELFYKSIGHPDAFKAVDVLGHLVIRRNGVTACVGGGHFVCSLRREVIKAMPSGPALQAVCGGSETNWLDVPPERLGYWRLATEKAYVQHMGNHLEKWMYDEVAGHGSGVQATLTGLVPLPALRAHWTALLPYAFRARAGILLGRRVRDKLREKAAAQKA